MSRFGVVVLASGAGSNLQAILDRAHGRQPAGGGPEIVVAGVGSDKEDAPALGRARDADITTGAFRTGDYPSRELRDQALGDWIDGLGADLVVLAGYMQVLSAPFVERFRDRAINIHPALLPAFPGLDAIGQALDHGVKVTGVTVHFVDEGVDTGPIIAQRAVEVPADGDRRRLEATIHEVEHELLSEAIGLIASARVSKRPDGTVLVDDPARHPGR